MFHEEQLSLIIRFVDVIGEIVVIKERFLGVHCVSSTTGIGLTEILLDMISKYKLEISDCRGQGYDNGSNIKGKNSSETYIKYKPFSLLCALRMPQFNSSSMRCSTVISEINYFAWHSKKSIYTIFSLDKSMENFNGTRRNLSFKNTKRHTLGSKNKQWFPRRRDPLCIATSSSTENPPSIREPLVPR
jgi:hypothetical protein